MTLNIGQGGFIVVQRLLWVAPYEGDAMRRLKAERQAHGAFVDLTRGRGTATLVALDDGTLIASSVSAEALQRRFKKEKGK